MKHGNMYKFLVFGLYIFFITMGVSMGATLEHIKLKTKSQTKKIDVIYEHNNKRPIISISLMFQNNGYLTDDKKALSSLSSALLNEGSKKDGSAKFAKKLENEAISLYSSYGRDYFSINLQFLSESKKRAFELLKQLLEDINYDEATLNKIKNIKIGQLKSKEDDYNYVAQKELKALVYKGTPLANMPSGEQEDIAKITLKDIKNKLSQTLSVDALMVAASGDITLDELSKDLNYALTSLKQSPKPKIEKVYPINKPKTKITKKDTTQAFIYFASPYYGNVKEDYKAQIAGFVLGSNGFGTRLMEEIRVKRGLSYGIYAYYENSATSGSFVGYMQCDLNKADASIKTIQQIVDEFVDKGITKDELKKAKDYILGSEPLKNELLSSRVSRAYGFYIRGLDLDYANKRLELINKITLKEINDFIKKHKEIKNISYSLVMKK